MFLETLKLVNFRNYNNLELNFNKNMNIIYGDNAQGKTNILEAIYILGLTKSHRFSTDNDLIKYSEKGYLISAITKKGRVSTKLEVVYKDLKKIYKVNLDQIKKVSDYISEMNIILFCPEDINLIKDGPDIRRKYLNDEISQLYPMYYKVNQDFIRILRLRNEMLYKLNNKESVDMNYFNVVTDYYIDKSYFIYQARNKFINKINEKATEIFKKIMKEKSFEIKYSINLDISIEDKETFKDKFKNKLEKNLKNDIRLNSTQIGPHRDDFDFILNGKNLKNHGSQGQQKLSVLVLKLSEIELFKKQTEEYPILLLDDVFSEFDEEKRKNILKYIRNKVQTIITTTDLENFKSIDIKKYKVIHVKDGKLTEV